MSNFLTTAREGVLNYVFGDTGDVGSYIQARRGTIIRWNSTDKFKPMLAAGDMPLAIVTPTVIPISQANNDELTLEYTLHMEFYTAGKSPEPCEELLATVIDCLKAGRLSRFGLAASARFVTARWGSPRFQAETPPGKDATAANCYWKAEFDFVCLIRR